MPLDNTTIAAGEIIEIPISSIASHRPELYSRLRHDPMTVEDYASRITPAPPIWINQDYIGIDYYHRYLAALERGETTINAIIVPTRDARHHLDLGIDANLNNGLAYSQADKRRLAGMWYDPYAGNLMDQREKIAARLRVNLSTVRDWLKGKDHKRRDEAREQFQEVITQHPDWSQDRVAEELGRSKGWVNHAFRFRSELLEPAEPTDDFPADFEPEWSDVWNFNYTKAGIRHFGKNDPRIIQNLLWRYARTRKDAVLDLFAGGGVSIDVCREWHRECFAFDREPRHPRGDDIQRHDIVIDGLPTIPCWDSISLVFLDPPYGPQAARKYSDDRTDLGNMSVEEFEQAMVDLINKLGTVLPSGAAISLLIRASQWSGPEHRIRDHPYEIRRRVDLRFEQEISCPS